MRRIVISVAFSWAFASACGKTAPGSVPPLINAVEAAPSATAMASGAGEANPLAASMRGAYTSAAGTLFVPAEWPNVHWKGRDTVGGLGEGAMTVTVDPRTHRVAGELDGPLGPAKLDGFAADGMLTATVMRKDPSDLGFVGTAVGTFGSGRAEGTMSLSPSDGSAVRSVTFALGGGSAK